MHTSCTLCVKPDADAEALTIKHRTMTGVFFAHANTVLAPVYASTPQCHLQIKNSHFSFEWIIGEAGFGYSIWVAKCKVVLFNWKADPFPRARSSGGSLDQPKLGLFRCSSKFQARRETSCCATRKEIWHALLKYVKRSPKLLCRLVYWK